MSDEIELTGNQAGLDRREVIKRGAILGGVVWAAPVIQSIGSPAFAITPTPVETPTPTPEAQNMSFIAAVVTCNGITYRVKYEDGDGWDDEPGPPDEHPSSCTPAGWSDATPENGGDLGFQVYVDDDGQWVLFVPEDCDLLDGVLWAGQQDGCSSQQQTTPCGPGLPAGTCYLFT